MARSRASGSLILLCLALVGLERAQTGTSATGQTVQAGPPREVLVGVNYFAGWWRETPNKWQSPDGQDWRARFPERVPLLGEYNDQSTMDREIATASNYGVDFFAFLYYPLPAGKEPEPHTRRLNDGVKCFMKSPWASRIAFMIEVCNHRPFEIRTDEDWQGVMEFCLAAMRHPSYLRVGGGPVLKVHYGWGLVEQSGGDVARAKAWLDRLRASARSNGLGEVRIGGGVVSAGEAVPAEHWAPKLYDFTACYMDLPIRPMQPTDHPFDELAAHINARRGNHDKDVIPHLPFLAAGWNPRPWPGEKRGAFALPTRDQWARELRQMATDLRAARNLGFPIRQGQVQRAFTIYAWNEFGEGGFVAPTRGDGYLKLEGIREVFGTAGGRDAGSPAARPGPDRSP